MNLLIRRSVLALSCLALSLAVVIDTQAGAPSSFSSGKRAMYRLYTGDERTTFYCGCTFNARKHVDLDSCNYTVRKSLTRASRTEAEHLIPAHEFGSDRACWKTGGRKLCSQTDKTFRQMEGDLFNLRPAIGEVNGDRSNFEFGLIDGEPRIYGASCDMEIDWDLNRAEPPDTRRGDIARVYFYFERQYGLTLDADRRRLYQQWAIDDPVDDAELSLIRRTERVMNRTFLPLPIIESPIQCVRAPCEPAPEITCMRYPSCNAPAESLNLN